MRSRSTVDCVVWDGLTSGGEIEVVFLDVKTGKAVLNQRQRRIGKAIEAGRVRFEVFRSQLTAELPALELTLEFISPPTSWSAAA
jgi:predicted Holliday junction resolvase-like endonuclease